MCATSAFDERARTRRSRYPRTSLDTVGCRGAPRSCRSTVVWVIQAEIREPTLAGQRLDPVLLRLTRWRGGTERQVDRAVGVFDDVVAR